MKTQQSVSFYTRKPKWIRIQRPAGETYNKTRSIVREHGLHTICEEAKCPNIGECWHQGTATFLLMGDICTRGCTFCSVMSGRPIELDDNEPQRIAEASDKMNLKHIVLTSVNRDDLGDGGAKHFADTVNEIKKRLPKSTIEILVPDFRGNWDALQSVVQADIAVLNHNLETVPRLYPEVRPKADYKRSLELIKLAGKYRPDITTKSGIMMGLGETQDETISLMDDLVETGCSVLTIGQYLQPTMRHRSVKRFLHPDEFDELASIGKKRGLKMVESSPFVRSSYHAERHVLPKG